LRFAAVLAAGAALLAASSAIADAASEAAAAATFEAASGNQAMLRLILQSMPKGGDLHNHLSGTPSAEDFLDWAGEAGYCADATSLDLLPPPCADGDKVARMASQAPFAYARLVDHLSTRGWQRGVGADEVTGHTQFFITFERFGAVAQRNIAPMMVVALRTTAGDNASYLELMHNPVAMMRHILAAPDAALGEAGLEARYAEELKDLAPVIAASRAELDADEAEVRRTLVCGTSSEEPACHVALRYLASGFRALPPAQVFRSLILCFALADADPRYVGVNIVQPEDWAVSLRDYDLHMAMFRFLEKKYPGVRRTMHAGELAFGLVPPADMKNHMRKAIDAGAERIGHGVAIAYEDDAAGTLQRMARERIAVEVNLSSNAVILGVTGDAHPLRLYRRFGVPVVLSTDDQGILRTDLTNEYMRAVREQGLRYTDLKDMARASLEYAFLPGASLWRDGRLGVPVRPCMRSLDEKACTAFLESSEKARLQADLEARFDRFERSLGQATWIGDS
jgi:adenosine deaminase